MQSPLRSKFLLLPLAAALSLLAVRLIAQTTPTPTTTDEFKDVLHLVFAGEDRNRVVDKKKTFTDALAQYSKDYEKTKKKMHRLYWRDSDTDVEAAVLPGGLDEPAASREASATSPTADKKIIGRHVAQTVGFDSLDHLEKFVAAVKPTPTPTPGKGG
jgi:hypothetical protein